jgi:hypothetical protein
MSALEQEHTASAARMDTVGGIYRADPTSHSVDDNDAVRFVTDAYGRQYVVPVGGVADSAALGTVAPEIIGALYSAAPATRHDGDAVRLQCTSTGSLHTSDADKATDDAAAPTVGPLVMGKFGASSPDANDAAPLRCGSTGELIVSDVGVATDDAAAPTTGPLVMAKFGASSPDANDATPIQCDATGAVLVTTDAHSAVAGTKSVMAGGYASTVAPAAVTDADAARMWVDARGRLNTRQCFNYKQGSGDFQISANPCYVSHIEASCSGAINIVLYDNAAEAGTAVLKTYLPANISRTIWVGTVCATACYLGKDAGTGEFTVFYEDLA